MWRKQNEEGDEKREKQKDGENKVESNWVKCIH
jgi:hypothetical protein